MLDLHVGNYRGSLHIKEQDGKYYWAVECDMDNCENWGWEEIPKHLFDALALYSQTEEIKMEKYKDSNINPRVGDTVLLNSEEVEVASIRLDKNAQIKNCAFDGKLCLDSPENFKLTRRNKI